MGDTERLSNRVIGHGMLVLLLGLISGLGLVFSLMDAVVLWGDRTDNGAVRSNPRPQPSPCGAPDGVRRRRAPDSPYPVVPEPTTRSEGSHRPIDI